ncbi:MAG: hypothetical protein EXR71_03480 [Myxococcales bacterium]|nr:hypothetical protein [Myxococcales bacterium]
MLSLLMFAACTTEPTACTELFAYSVTVNVSAESGGALTNVVGTYRVDGGAVADCESVVDGQLWCGGEEEGHFEITIVADGHGAQTQEVDVAADECHVIGETLDFVLVADPVGCTEEIRPSVLVNLSSELDPTADYGLTNGWVAWKDADSLTDEAPAPCETTDQLNWSCGAEFVGNLTIWAGADDHETTTRDVTTELTEDECHVDTEEIAIVLAFLGDQECTQEIVPAVIANLTSSIEADAALENLVVTWRDVDTDMLELPCDNVAGATFACAPEAVGNLSIVVSADFHGTEERLVTTVLTEDECHVETQTLDIELQVDAP